MEPGPVDKEPVRASNGDRKANNKTVIIVIVIVVVLGVGSYLLKNYFARKTAENLVENLLEAQTGSKVEVNSSDNSVSVSNNDSSFSTGSQASWPTDLPAGAPKYSGGQLTSVSKIESPSSWTMVVSNTSQSDFDSYKAAILASGWTSKGDVQFMVDTAQYEKSGWDLTATFDSSSNGVLISVINSL